LSTATPEKGVRRRLSRAERHRKIIEAGLKVFGARGFRGVSMADIASECGVTKGLLYEHYDSKEELYDACVEWERSRVFDHLGAVVREHEHDPLRAFVEEYFDYVEEHRDRSWLLYGDASATATNRMRAENAKAVAAMIGHVFGPAPDELPAEQLLMLASGLVGQGEHLARHWSQHPEIPRQDAVSIHYAMSAAAIASVFGENIKRRGTDV
jgi:AcrR family transcriptional regulator